MFEEDGSTAIAFCGFLGTASLPGLRRAGGYDLSPKPEIAAGCPGMLAAQFRGNVMANPKYDYTGMDPMLARTWSFYRIALREESMRHVRSDDADGYSRDLREIMENAGACLLAAVQTGVIPRPSGFIPWLDIALATHVASIAKITSPSETTFDLGAQPTELALLPDFLCEHQHGGTQDAETVLRFLHRHVFLESLSWAGMQTVDCTDILGWDVVQTSGHLIRLVSDWTPLEHLGSHLPRTRELGDADEATIEFTRTLAIALMEPAEWLAEVLPPTDGDQRQAESATARSESLSQMTPIGRLGRTSAACLWAARRLYVAISRNEERALSLAAVHLDRATSAYATEFQKWDVKLAAHASDAGIKMKGWTFDSHHHGIMKIANHLTECCRNDDPLLERGPITALPLCKVRERLGGNPVGETDPLDGIHLESIATWKDWARQLEIELERLRAVEVSPSRLGDWTTSAERVAPVHESQSARAALLDGPRTDLGRPVLNFSDAGDGTYIVGDHRRQVGTVKTGTVQWALISVLLQCERGVPYSIADISKGVDATIEKHQEQIRSSRSTPDEAKFDVADLNQSARAFRLPEGRSAPNYASLRPVDATKRLRSNLRKNMSGSSAQRWRSAWFHWDMKDYSVTVKYYE